jgi:hypothetical protein
VILQRLKDSRDLFPCHDFRNSLLPTSPHYPFELTDFAIEDMSKEKHKGIERLVLSSRRAVSLHRQVREKGHNMFFSHLLWMFLSMKENESSNPPQIALLGGVGKVSESNALPYEVKKFNGAYA